MLNRDFLKDSITLFSRHTSLSENEPSFTPYRNKVMPTFIEYCSFDDTKIYNVSKVGNTSLGDVSITFSLANKEPKSNITLVYRIIDDKKVYLKYVDEKKYNTIGNDQQMSEYFTLASGLVIVQGLRTELPVEMPIVDTTPKELDKQGLKRYTLINIDVGHTGTGIIKMTGKID